MPEFERWYRDEHPRLLGSIIALSADRDLAADVTDEAFTRALANWTRVAVMTSPAGWTYRVALHTLRRRHRRRNHERLLVERIEPLSSTAPDAFAAHADVWIAVAALPDRQRTAVVLRYVADLPEAAIAEAMGVTRGTVASNLSDARRSPGRRRAHHRGVCTMNELERAARQLVANPSAEPTPVADLQRAADSLRRGRRWRRIALAAPVTIVVLVLAGVVVSRATSADRITTSLESTGSQPGTTSTSDPPPGSVPDGSETVTAFAATGTIDRGLSGDEAGSLGLIEPTQIPIQFAPTTAVHSLDALKGKVAVFNIAPDTIIVEGMFVDPAPASTPALPAPIPTPEGEERLAWTLGPDQPVPLASATVLQLAVTYTSCHAQFEIAEPIVAADANVIVVTVFGHQPLPANLCAAPETTSLTVQLDAPVGDRRLFDGSQPVAVEVPTP